MRRHGPAVAPLLAALLLLLTACGGGGSTPPIPPDPPPGPQLPLAFPRTATYWLDQDGLPPTEELARYEG